MQLATSQRVDDLLGALTLDEKALLTAGEDLWSTVAVARALIPKVRLTDGPNGARGPALPGENHEASSACVPCGSALGATWNPDLVQRVGVMLGQEARTKTCRVLLAPTVNIHRAPLAGRNFECYSEDPLLAGQLAAAFVRGVQSEGVGTTVKHFAGNEAEFERTTMNSRIGERALREIYLVPFELAVRNGGALGVMTGYNRLNGLHCAEHGPLLQILREEWGFAGFVVSDWYALGSTVGSSLAGLDLEMPGPGRIYGAALAEAVRGGEVSQAMLDAQVGRILAVFDRLGALDDPPAEQQSIDLPEHRAIAYEAATEAVVLLRNDGFLPLDPAALTSVAVIGANANRAQIMGGGSAALRPHYLVTPLQAIRQRLEPDVAVRFEPGCRRPRRPVAPTGPDGRGEPTDDELLDRAVAAAAGADVAIVVVGSDYAWESEGHDRPCLELPYHQDDLVRRVLAANANTVVVLNTGAPVALEWADDARAVLQMWFGGQEMAAALVDVLTGAAEPGGRLPTTFPVRLEHTPSYGNFPGENGEVQYGEGLLVGYRWYDARHLPTRFPFGHGMSYTTFTMGQPRLSARDWSLGHPLNVEVTVANTGQRRGAEVVQCYVAPMGARLMRPPKELKAFAKVWLDPGEHAVVRLELDDRAFAYWDPGDPDWTELRERRQRSIPFGDVGEEHRTEAGWYVDPGEYHLHVGRSSRDIAHVAAVTIATGGRIP